VIHDPHRHPEQVRAMIIGLAQEWFALDGSKVDKHWVKYIRTATMRRQLMNGRSGGSARRHVFRPDSAYRCRGADRTRVQRAGTAQSISAN